MKVSIECKDMAEAEAVKRAMTDPACRAFILITGTLMGLGSDRSRQRAINYVHDHFEEQQQRESVARDA